jgi:dihydroorotase
MSKILITNGQIINEGHVTASDILIDGERIARIDPHISASEADEVLDASGMWVMPGAIDDQVHFREPGLTHKGDLYTESRAAVAGGVTSFMEMPNTVPNALTQELLEDKYRAASEKSLANYSFFMGASNDNIEEVLKTDETSVCGVKIFMGSSTGNMLVDNETALNDLFSKVPMLIATHCEDEHIIQENLKKARDKYGEDVPMEMHPLIRSEEACYKSSSFAVELAKKHGTRLHILHISTARETHLFSNELPLKDKKITAEACIHHLWFSVGDYKDKGSLIKWNPAVKTADDRAEILKAVLDDRIDVIATDHAPHTLEEKQRTYFQAPSGGPLVQHSIVAMLEMYHQGKISLDRIVEKMSHNPAILFNIQDRGYIREGYYADLAIVHPDASWTVSRENLLYKCGWSPFEGQKFRSAVRHTFVSGHWAWKNGELQEGTPGKRLTFHKR